MKYLESIAPGKSLVQQHFVSLHSQNSRDLVINYNASQNLLPKNILKKAFEHHLNTPEEIINLRVSFIRNYSALSIACYILGIGDRHLDNFLINLKSCEIYAIDFGFSFGQALNNMIPELVPFRLTPQIRNIIYPLGIKGAIRQTMIDVFTAFKNNKHMILDYCDVFVKEPLLDWTKKNGKNSKKKMASDEPGAQLNLSKNNSNSTSYANSNVNINNNNNSVQSRFLNNDSEISHLYDIEKNNCESAKWIPMQKLMVIDNKLSNFNPILINLEEFKETMHANDVINYYFYNTFHVLIFYLLANL